jgi:hypothetical protein
MSGVLVLGKVIRQDDQGRFCINDLHKAAGKQSRHGPARWLGNQQTKELVAEIAQEMGDTEIPVSVVKGGLSQGTYVTDDLVYAYAMWISPKFYLRVIRDFKRHAGQDLRSSLGLLKQRLALESKDKTSKIRASFGSHLMLDRRRDLPGIEQERAQLDAEMQQRLFEGQPLLPHLQVAGAA